MAASDPPTGAPPPEAGLDDNAEFNSSVEDNDDEAERTERLVQVFESTDSSKEEGEAPRGPRVGSASAPTHQDRGEAERPKMTREQRKSSPAKTPRNILIL